MPQDLTPCYLNLAPRVVLMKKYASLAKQLIHHAKNGVLSHVCTTKGIQELALLHPSWFEHIQDKVEFALLMSRCLRTLLFWYREFKDKERAKQTILKKSLVGDEAVLQNVVVNLILKNKEEALIPETNFLGYPKQTS